MTDLWGKIEKDNWRATPSIAGRPANEEDVKAGRAVFFVQGHSEAVPMDLPAAAIQQLDNGTKVPVVVIQAERNRIDITLGVRPLSGGNGVCVSGEVEFIDDFAS